MEKKREVLSFCRQCMGMCGTVVDVDEKGRLIGVRGDSDDPSTLGYACFKGLNAPEMHNSPDRVLEPMKRMPDGSFAPIELEQALDEISETIASIIERDGPEAIAGYRGGGAFFTSSSVMMLGAFLRAVGSPKAFSSVTIDQSAKLVAAGRVGLWPPGRVPFNRGDVFLLVGGNPLVSVSANGFDTRNPTKRIKQAKARGMKLIVIDPRRTETARYADVFLQPLPGEDSTLLAGLLHIILEQGWQDRAFCERYADDVEALRRAVSSFEPDAVARRAGVPVEKLRQAAELFGRDCRMGSAAGSTGPDMSPDGNLAEHLIECLNIVCGRLLREGDEIEHPGAILPRMPRKAEVVPAPRWWEQGYRSRLGAYGLLDGELPTGTLPDEILTPGAGRVRCLISHGGNPVSAIPQLGRVVEAFRDLELLVAIEPFMTMTARLAHYVLPPTLQYERADLPVFLFESLVSQEPYTRYTPAVVSPPTGSRVRDDHYYFWSIARRLGLELEIFGESLGLEEPPTTEEILALTARSAPIPFEELKRAEAGCPPRSGELAGGGRGSGESPSLQPASAGRRRGARRCRDETRRCRDRGGELSLPAGRASPARRQQLGRTQSAVDQTPAALQPCVPESRRHGGRGSGGGRRRRDRFSARPHSGACRRGSHASQECRLDHARVRRPARERSKLRGGRCVDQ